MPADYTEGFAVREASWHGLETLLQDYPMMGDLFSGNPLTDPYILAGHDFDLNEVELYTRRVRPSVGGYPETTTYPKLVGYRAIQNSKTGTVFQVARDSWTAIANEVGWELAAAFTDHNPNVKVATGGVLGDGATCWLLLELDEPFTIPGDNTPTLPYVNVHWNHDGTGALKAFRAFIRTVCRNTLEAGLLTAERSNVSFSIRHTKGAHFKVDEVKAALSGVRSATAAYIEAATELQNLHVSMEQRELFVQALIPEPVGQVVSEKVRENVWRDRQKVRAIFDGPTIPGAGSSGYELVQAGVEYLDWLRGYRNSETLFRRQLLTTDSLKASLVPMVKELVG